MTSPGVRESLKRLMVIAAAVAALVAATASAAMPATKVTAALPPHSLIRAGTLSVCSDIPLPPFEYYNAKNQLVGFEVDLTDKLLAPRMGLKATWVNSVFDTIIAALDGSKCDVIIGDMFITPARSRQIRQIPYLTSGEQFLVRKGNPDKINPLDVSTLCGKTLSIELGNAEVADAKAYSQQCRKMGKPAITILQPQKMPDSLLQLQTGHAQAVFNDSPIVEYYAKVDPSAFEVAGPILKNTTLLGIGVVKSNKALSNAVIAALKSIESDGAYSKLLDKWGFQNAKVPAPR